MTSVSVVRCTEPSPDSMFSSTQGDVLCGSNSGRVVRHREEEMRLGKEVLMVSQ